MKLNTEPIKNWFGFTRRERRSSVILLALVFVILIIRIAIPEKNIIAEDITASMSGIGEPSGSDSDEAQPSVKLFSFDPNTVPYETLIKLGFAEREANTLLAYRKSGGKFRQPSDLNKVYGIEEGKAKMLIPFVEINVISSEKKQTDLKDPQKTLINLNSCDSALLVTLPGIGPVLSVRIIKYRNLLGGYVSVNQLKEVYGLPPETFEKIKGRLYADSSAIIGININTAGYKELSRLPYLENYEIMSILKYRELKGRIEKMNDLTDNKLITVEKADKVRPYIDFR
jgi:DNA uptake protein ComE-like DNA-binding protein